MGIYIRPFKKEDLAAFDPIEPLTSTEINDMEFAQAIEDSGLAVTGLRYGKIVGCGGVHPIDKYSGELWLRISKECNEFRIETLRLIKSALKIIEETYPFEILTATVKCGFDTSICMIERFGFKYESETLENGLTWRTYIKRTKHEQCLIAS